MAAATIADRHATYWSTSAGPLRAPAGGDPLPGRTDVIVIGAGLTGLATALHLARRGVAVHVVERDEVGAGASTRNAGMVLAGLKPSPAKLLSTYGGEFGVRLYHASLEAIDHAERFVRDEDIDCDFGRTGALWAAYTPRDLVGLRRAQQLLGDTFGHATEVVERDGLAAELGSRFYVGGLVDPRSAAVHPGKLVAGLTGRALDAGVTVHEGTEVTVVESGRDSVALTVREASGATRTVRAADVVVATNGYTPASVPALRRRVIPIGSHIVVTEPLEPQIADALVPRGRMVFDTKHVLRYFRVLPDRRLLFGGRTSFRDIDADTAALHLKRALTQVFPQLGGVRIAYRWSGKVAFTFDQLPHVGTTDGLHHALGYCGHGVGMSLLAARAVARLIVGEPARSPFADIDFPTRPYYRVRPWFLPVVGAWYGALDRLHR